MAIANFLEYPHDHFLSTLVVCCFLIIPLCMFKKTFSRKPSHSHIPTNWPLFGMAPTLIRNSHRVHDLTTDILEESGATFLGKGPWFTNMDMLLTSDPANIHYMLSKNFSNYPKGPKFRKIFDALGDGIFNADHELWELQRKITLSIFTHPKFHTLLERNVWVTVEQGLFPVLDFTSKQEIETDLQDIFQRFGFDVICKLFLEYDPRSLSIDFPYIPAEKALTDGEEAILYRHLLPETLWKLQSWLQIGKEKKMSQAWKALDQFLYHCITLKQDEIDRNFRGSTTGDHVGLFAAYMNAYKDKNIKGTSGDTKKFLRDTLLSLLVAGRDTTSTTLTWFFFLLGKNPSVESKIREEIRTTGLGEKLRTKNFRVDQESSGIYSQLVYLHGALCESLRLYPPIGLNHKSPSKPDILPSGHRVDPDSKIILSFYSMGRMESIWGEDCMEFKPERWISEQGGIKHVPSYKFTAFNAGPRTCLGKEMAFTQMKIVATSIIWNYRVELVDGHPIYPSNSVVLQMKYGLKVRLTKIT